MVTGMRPGCRGHILRAQDKKGAQASLAGQPVEGIFSLGRRGGGEGFLTVPLCRAWRTVVRAREFAKPCSLNPASLGGKHAQNATKGN